MVNDYVTNVVDLFDQCKIIMEMSRTTFGQTPRGIRKKQVRDAKDKEQLEESIN